MKFIICFLACFLAWCELCTAQVDTIVTAVKNNSYSTSFINSLQGKEKKRFFDEQEAYLVEQATRYALFKAYPSTISAASVKYSENIKFSQFNAQTQSTYKRIMYDFANAELMEVLDKPCRHYNQNGEVWIECSVTIKARKIINQAVEFTALTLDGTDINQNIETEFNHGQEFYMYFKTPESGYMAIYIDDFKNTQQLLPYFNDNSNESCIKVEADIPYLLFSPTENHDRFGNLQIVEPLSVFAASTFDLNRIYVIFSKQPFNKPALTIPNEQMTENANIGKGYALPKQTASDFFMQWLQKNRLQNPDFQIKIIDISIAKQ